MKSAALRCTARVALLVTAGCVGPSAVSARDEPLRHADVQDLGTAAAIVATRAATEGGSTRLGWDVRVDGEVIRWRECRAADACSQVERSASSKDLVGIQAVGVAPSPDADGSNETVEVERLRFGPPAPGRVDAPPAEDARELR